MRSHPPVRASAAHAPGASGVVRVGFACGLLLLGGCSMLPSLPEPWVRPYERERLADPMMKPLRDASASRHREHVLTVREAARGANGVQGGGCGCN